MSDERPKLISRRDFFVSGAFGITTSAMSLSGAMRGLDLQILDKYIERDGIFISGEDKVMTQNGIGWTTRVNRDAFIGTLDELAFVEKCGDQLIDFLHKYPLRVSISVPADPNVNGFYRNSRKTNNPYIKYTDQYISRYFNESLKNEANTFDPTLDRTVIHELYHLVQDARGDLVMGDAIKNGVLSYTSLLGSLIGLNIADRVTDRRSFLKRSAAASLSGALSFVTANTLFYGVDPIEEQAYTRSNELVNNPIISKYRGSYFTFNRVS